MESFCVSQFRIVVPCFDYFFVFLKITISENNACYNLNYICPAKAVKVLISDHVEFITKVLENMK